MGVSFQEYLTGNEYTAYPFKENSLGLVEHGGAEEHGPTAKLPKDFLIDAVLITPTRFYGQIFLSEIVNAGGGAYEFWFFSEERRVVAAFSVPSIPPERTVVTYSDAASGVVLRLLTGPSFASFLGGVLTVDEFDGTLPFETAAVEIRPKRVEKFIIENPVPEEVDGEAIFLAGFNIEYIQGDLFAFEDAGLDTTVINIEANPGAGAGRYNPCDDPPAPIDYIAKINGVAPDEDGNLFLKPLQCHRFDLQPEDNTIYFFNDCTSCCDCEDYANVVEVLDRLFQRCREVKELIDEIIEDFNEHVTIYNEDLWQRYRSVFLTGNGHVGLREDDMESLDKPKSGNYCTLVFHVNNRSCVNLTNVKIKGDCTPTFDVEQILINKQAPVTNGTTEADYTGPASIGPGFTILIPNVTVKPGSDHSVYLLMKLDFPQVAHGTVVAYVEYETPQGVFTTDTITVTW